MFNRNTELMNDLKEDIQDLKKAFISLKDKNLENEIAIIEIIKDSKLSDDEIYEKYKYIIWNNLPKLLRRYLADRYNIIFAWSWCSYFTVRENEPVGMILDKIRKIEPVISDTTTNSVGDKPSKN